MTTELYIKAYVNVAVYCVSNDEHELRVTAYYGPEITNNRKCVTLDIPVDQFRDEGTLLALVEMAKTKLSKLINDEAKMSLLLNPKFLEESI